MALKGTISGGKSLGGKISAAEVPEEYEGSYEVTPKAFSGQVLITAGKKMKKNVTIDAVPYYETSNTSEGKTVYIASDT